MSKVAKRAKFNIKTQAFIDCLVFKYDGLEPTKAYAEIYGFDLNNKQEANSASACVSKMLNKSSILDEIEYKKSLLPRFRTEKHIFADMVQLQHDAKSETVKSQMLGFQAQTKAMLINKNENKNEEIVNKDLLLDEATQGQLIERLTQLCTLTPSGIMPENSTKLVTTITPPIENDVLSRGNTFAKTEDSLLQDWIKDSLKDKDVPAIGTTNAGTVHAQDSTQSSEDGSGRGGGTPDSDGGWDANEGK